MDLLRRSGYGDGDSSSDESTCNQKEASGGDCNRNDATAAANLGTNDDPPPRPPPPFAAAGDAATTHKSTGKKGQKRTRNCDDYIAKDAVVDNDSVRGHLPVGPKKFVRSVPHTPGNWAGHIFAPLSPPARPNSSPYDATNLQSSNDLRRAARLLIADFEEALARRSGGRLSGVVVSHIPDGYGSSSSSDSESDGTDSDSGSGDEQETRPTDGSSNSKNPRLQDGKRKPQHQAEPPSNHSSAATPPHLSLSRPFYLQLPSIQSFVSELQKRLSYVPPVPVTLDPAQLEVLANDDCTRSFLTVSATEATSRGIVRMIRAVDDVMRKFGHEPYYEEAKVHVSIASCPGDVRNVLRGMYGISSGEVGRGENGIITEQEKGCASGVLPNAPPFTFMVDRLCCTFGTTKEFVIHLAGVMHNC